MSVKVGLPLVARPEARLFILGSLPGDASLAAQRYYAHPTNQFWRLLGGAIGEELQELPYDVRLERLAERGVGLWDVIGSASRAGSLDQAIRDVNHNAVDRLLHDYQALRGIAFNGAAAAAVGRRLISPGQAIKLVDLPSSSAANTQPLAAKAQIWSQLRAFVE